MRFDPATRGAYSTDASGKVYSALRTLRDRYLADLRTGYPKTAPSCTCPHCQDPRPGRPRLPDAVDAGRAVPRVLEHRPHRLEGVDEVLQRNQRDLVVADGVRHLLDRWPHRQRSASPHWPQPRS